MISITSGAADLLLKEHFDSFGYICDYGAVVGDKEFIIYTKDNQNYLLHKSELEAQGIFIKLKSTGGST